ncbi:hypothetical protein RB653_005555 [Dictyostelium firmibasis]|uniref:non-specific serine/threonine protein kinase n=1 Tax=Dictyostelium firmibasis TaxID=79012 RepID=A0AAN7U1F9_9MYCE
MDANECNNSENSTTITKQAPSSTISTKVVKLDEIGILISQGAEAKTYETDLYGLKCIVKERFSKAYRHPTLDQKISAKRILQEVRSLNKCKKKGIQVPSLYLVDIGNNRIYMEFIKGETVKHYLYKNQESIDHQDQIILTMKELGKQVGIIHEMNVIHGDLTTSNMLLRESTLELVFIDFGLSYTSNSVEDKAVDLYVLERAFISTHPNSEQLFQTILSAYELTSPSSKIVIQKLNQVRLRGRKKTCFG